MHFVHPTANPDDIIYGSIQSGFEYSGQKCSALSRMYCPQSLWPKIRDGMVEIHKKIQVGSPLDGKTFVSAVIDQAVSINKKNIPRVNKTFFMLNSAEHVISTAN